MIERALYDLYAALTAASLPCMVGGSVGAMLHGEPRATMDIDVVVDAHPADAERLQKSLDRNGWYVPPVEVIRHELAKGSRGSFNVIDPESGLKLDCYPAGTDPLIRWALERRVPMAIGGQPVQVAPVEYLIVMKLRYHAMSGQDKHLRDVTALLAHAAPDLDTVRAWCATFGVTGSLAACMPMPRPGLPP